jgi:hypothetical protein
VAKQQHITIDYAHAIELPQLPHASDAEAIYFSHSLSVRWFSVLNDSQQIQHHYFYSEVDGETVRTSIACELLCLFPVHVRARVRQSLQKPHNVISLVNHFLHLPETRGGLRRDMVQLTVHADGAGGQNKNNALFQFLMYVLSSGKFPSLETISVLFMLPGHTHCRVDGGFGSRKQCIIRQPCFTVDDVAAAARSDSHRCYTISSLNFRDWTSGRAGIVYWPCYRPCPHTPLF